MVNDKRKYCDFMITVNKSTKKGKQKQSRFIYTEFKILGNGIHDMYDYEMGRV